MEWLCRATNRATAQPPSPGLFNTSGQGHITLLSAVVRSCSYNDPLSCSQTISDCHHPHITHYETPHNFVQRLSFPPPYPSSLWYHILSSHLLQMIILLPLFTVLWADSQLKIYFHCVTLKHVRMSTWKTWYEVENKRCDAKNFAIQPSSSSYWASYWLFFLFFTVSNSGIFMVFNIVKFPDLCSFLRESQNEMCRFFHSAWFVL